MVKDEDFLFPPVDEATTVLAKLSARERLESPQGVPSDVDVVAQKWKVNFRA